MSRTTTFDAAYRARLLAGLRDLDELDPTAGRRSLELVRRYAAGLPRVRLSRCPHTGEELVHSVDIFGLDGPWWQYEVPARPDEVLPPSFYALTGAMKLDSVIEDTPHIVRPGPGIPFVVPWMLEHDQIAAVVSVQPVGRHVGYVIAYFSTDPHPLLRRFNTWGRSDYGFAVDEYRAWHVAPEGEQWVDYDLAPWIERGKLAWIRPGDTKLELRTEVKKCPFVGLEGPRGFASVRYGRVFRPAVEAGASSSTRRNPPE